MATQAAMRKTEESQAGSSARGSSFYTAMRIMPPRERGAMYEIYHFCRIIDDIADEEERMAPRLEQLQQWRGDIALGGNGIGRTAHSRIRKGHHHSRTD